MEIDLPKPLYWTGSAKKDFKAFPLAVQRNMGMWLYVVQLGRMPYAAPVPSACTDSPASNTGNTLRYRNSIS